MMRFGWKSYRRLLTFTAALCEFGLAILTATTPSIATETVVCDGVWWQGLSDHDQVVAVEGMLSGYYAGYFDGYNIAPTPYSGPFYDYALKHMTQAQFKKAFMSLPPFPKSRVGDGINFGAIQSRISAIYQEHPEALKMDVMTILPCSATVGADCESVVTDALKSLNK